MSAEAVVGEILVRVGLSVAAVAIGVTALVIAVRTRTTDYPSKLANKLAELEADVSGFDLKLASALVEMKSIRGKVAAHARHNGTAANISPEIPAGAGVGVDGGLTIEQALFSRMGPVQRQSLLDQGYTVAGA